MMNSPIDPNIFIHKSTANQQTIMAVQEQHSCLSKMPVLVIEKILSNILNLTNVCRTCKRLYEIVCGMDKRRRVMYIKGNQQPDTTSLFTLDDDAAFASIMNSLRTIYEIKLRVDCMLTVELNKRQLERMTAIVKLYGANITSLKLSGLAISIISILELLQHLPNLESITLANGKVMGSVTEGATMPLQLSALKALEIRYFYGLLDFVNLIPAGSLNYYYSTGRSNQQSAESTQILQNILTKQYNIKYLSLEDYSDPTVLSVDHLQLENLILKQDRDYNDHQLMEIVKYHTNLRELRLIEHRLSGSSFKWICNNLKELEVFEVQLRNPPERNVFKMLAELKKLRHFRVNSSDYLFDNEFQLKNDSLEKLDIKTYGLFCCSGRLNKTVRSMVQSFINLTHLEMNFLDFSALSFVLSHCTTLTHLTTNISCLSLDILLTPQQRFPSIKHLHLLSNTPLQIVSLVVHTMPNLKNLSMPFCNLLFNVSTIKEFINVSKNLEYFYVNCFELQSDLSVDDVIETIRCLLDQLKGYQLLFTTLDGKKNFFKMKDILANEFNVRNVHGNSLSFYLHKGEEKKFYNYF